MSKKFDENLGYLLDRFDVAVQAYLVATFYSDIESPDYARNTKEECKQDIIKFIQNELWFYKHEIASLSGNDDIYEEE